MKPAAALAGLLAGGCNLLFDASHVPDGPPGTTGPITVELAVPSPVFGDEGTVPITLAIHNGAGRTVHYRIACTDGGFSDDKQDVTGETDEDTVQVAWAPPRRIGSTDCTATASLDPALADPVTSTSSPTLLMHVGGFGLGGTTPTLALNASVAVPFLPPANGMIKELTAAVSSDGFVELAVFEARVDVPGQAVLLYASNGMAVPSTGLTVETPPIAVTSQRVYYIVIQGQTDVLVDAIDGAGSPPDQMLGNTYPGFPDQIMFTASLARRHEVYGVLWPE